MFRLNLLILLLLCFLPNLSRAGEYQPGWDYRNFYRAVQGCREVIVFPQLQEYEKKALDKQQQPEPLRHELIAVSPVFDSMAGSACFCTLNEIAEEKTFSEFQAGVDFKNYMNSPNCRELIQQGLQKMKQQGNQLRLQ